MPSYLLVVEDDPGVARSIVRSLGPRYVIRVARTVAEGVDLVRSMQTRWDAVIADIGLPDGTGLAVLAECHPLRRGIPLLAITGEITPARVNDAFHVGARIVAKPVRAWMLRLLLTPRPFELGMAALLSCAQHYPERWDEATIAYALVKLESRDREWIAIPSEDWPDVLDELERRLRGALPAGIPRQRGSYPMH